MLKTCSLTKFQETFQNLLFPVQKIQLISINSTLFKKSSSSKEFQLFSRNIRK